MSDVPEVQSGDLGRGLIYREKGGGGGGKHEYPTLLLFYTLWCGACKSFRGGEVWPEIIRNAKQLGFHVRQCNADEEKARLLELVELKTDGDLGIPLLTLFNVSSSPNRPQIYNGDMSVAAITKWMRDNVASVSESKKKSESVTTKENTKEHKENSTKEEESKDKVGLIMLETTTDVKRFKKAYNDKNTTLVLQWYLAGCTPCLYLKQQMEKWANNNTSSTLIFAAAPGELAPRTYTEFPVTEIFHNGKLVQSIEGNKPTDIQHAFLQR